MQSVPPTPSTSSSPLPEIALELRPGDVWLEDGNVILVAQGVSFRVHRSVLSRNSEVFQDMFAFPQPEGEHSECLEGCPVIQLSDRHTELSHFLSALYDGRRYALHHHPSPRSSLIYSYYDISHRYFSRDSPLEFEAIIALIRLGTKYQAPNLRDEGLHRLEHLESIIINEEARLPSHHRHLLASPWKKENCITLVNLSDSLDLDNLLPLALYGCCQLEDALVDGSTQSDGSVETLSRLNLKRCLAARNNLAITQIRIMSDAHFCLALATNDCERRSSPAEGCLVKTMRIPSLPQMTNIAIWHPLRRLEMWWSGMSAIDLCRPCEAAVRAFHQAQMDKILLELPSVFGLA